VAGSGAGWAGALLALGFLLALCAPFRPYWLSLRAAEASGTRLVLGLTALLVGLGLLIFPAFGSDVFVYLDYERLWVVHGVNPLLAAPIMRPEDWAYAFVWIPQQPSPYGPLWPILSWPIPRLAGDDLWGSILGYKLLALASYVASCWLIWRTAEPGGRRRALLLFAWSPLVLFEVLGKAHNDGLLAVSALAAVWLARRKHQPALALLAATAGALVKVSGLAIVVALAVWLARQRRWRDLAVGLGASAALAVALYAPFWAGLDSLRPIFVQTSRVVWSPGSLVLLLTGTVGVPSAEVVTRVAMAAAFVGVCAVVARRARSLPGLANALLVATLLLMTTAFFAHYLVPVVGLAAVMADRRSQRLVTALSVGALAAYAVEPLGAALPSGWIGSPGYQALGSLLTLGPVAGVWLTDRCRGSGWLRRRG
jgi:alpha-1,6-mannosyltransferase